jgi:hypothetical protein
MVVGVSNSVYIYIYICIYRIRTSGSDQRETASVVKWSQFLSTYPEVRVLFPALPDFLRSNGSGTGFTQPR